MARNDDIELARALYEWVWPFEGRPDDLTPLLNLIGDARYVLLGEASHGTHDFYRVRAELTKRLIAEKGFTIVAAEADWPDAYRVNRYVRGVTSDEDASDALSDFRRFPAWMWRNADVLDFVGWLRAYNDHIEDASAKVGFYGIDLYSLHASAQAVLSYLDKTAPEEAAKARARYACFDWFGDDPQYYGYATGLKRAESCENEVVEQLSRLQAQRATLLERDGLAAQDEFLFGEQNARVVKNAERYYRTMYRGGVASWNLRDEHMADTIDALVRHFAGSQRDAKVVVWAHNSHLGDARATDRAQIGELNVGQLVRERHPGEVVSLGFSTHGGTVTAANDWDRPAERMRVRAGLPDSYEALFHAVARPKFILLPKSTPMMAALDMPRLQRAIGVIYRPESERQSHYYHARLTSQFDALIHLDETRALEPLERTAQWQRDELPETYPSGV